MKAFKNTVHCGQMAQQVTATESLKHQTGDTHVGCSLQQVLGVVIILLVFNVWLSTSHRNPLRIHSEVLFY